MILEAEEVLTCLALDCLELCAPFAFKVKLPRASGPLSSVLPSPKRIVLAVP